MSRGGDQPSHQLQRVELHAQRVGDLAGGPARLGSVQRSRQGAAVAPGHPEQQPLALAVGVERDGAQLLHLRGELDGGGELRQGRGRALADVLHAAQAGRAARKVSDPLRVQLDPLELV